MKKLVKLDAKDPETRAHRVREPPGAKAVDLGLPDLLYPGASVPVGSADPVAVAALTIAVVGLARHRSSSRTSPFP